MSAAHARPLLAYLCVALAAALVLVQGISLPRAVVPTAILGDAAESIQSFSRVAVAAPVQFRQGAEVATVGAPARTQIGEARVLTAAPRTTTRGPAATAPPQRRAGTGSVGKRHATSQQRSTAGHSSPKATRPGKGSARGTLRGQGGQPRASQRTSPRTQQRASVKQVRGKKNGRKHSRGPRRS